MKAKLLFNSLLLSVFFSLFSLNVYGQGVDTITFTSQNSQILDAKVRSYNPTQNYGWHGGLEIYAWTTQGQEDRKRAFINFEWSKLPEDITVVQAKLKLFNNPHISSTEGKHINPANGNNEFYIRRVTSEWSELDVNWNNQPTTTTLNQITGPETTDSNQNFEIDITDLLIDVLNTSEKYGFALLMAEEVPYRSITLSSSNSEYQNKHPQLQIIYETPLSLTERNNHENVKVYPNPVTNTLNISKPVNSSDEQFTIIIRDVLGKIIKESQLRFYESDESKSIDIPVGTPQGTYFIELRSKENFMTQKITVIN